MSAPPQSKGTPIADKRQLVTYLASGCKPPEAWRIGTEHEKFAYTREDLRPLPASVGSRCSRPASRSR
jgi:glutamate--cysteine ligase